jgi:hypothetical protein
MSQFNVEREFLRLQRDRDFAINTLAHLAMELISPDRKAPKEQIEANMAEAVGILKEIDKDSLKIADQVDIKLIINLLHG